MTRNWDPSHVVLWGALLLLVFACSGGCSDGPRVYPVRGRVLFEDGAPADTGTIEFRSVESGLNARARIAEDGSFQLTTFEKNDGAVPGKHQVIVIQQVMVETPRPRDENAPPESMNQPSTHRAHRLVSREFSRYDSSPLEFTVEPSDQNDLQVMVHQ